MSRTRAAFTAALVAGLLVVIAVLTAPALFPVWFVSQLLRSVLLLGLLGVLARAIIPLVVRAHLHPRSANWLTATLALATVLILLELAFTFVPRSHGNGGTYAARNWFSYYWERNELGFRERSPSSIDTTKRIVLVIGDSFTAGHGIRNPSDRFSDVLGRRLGTGYEVINLGRNGADSRAEFQTLLSQPWDPSVVILQYHPNDIENVAPDSGLTFAGFAHYPNRLTGVLATSSYLINFLYWLYPHQYATPYIEYFAGAFDNDHLLTAHLADLDRFVRYAQANHARLIVAVFPIFAAPLESRSITEAVGQFFQDRGADVVDVAALIDSIPSKARVVNSNDAHASIRVHRVVAQALYERVATGAGVTRE